MTRPDPQSTPEVPGQKDEYAEWLRAGQHRLSSRGQESGGAEGFYGGGLLANQESGGGEGEEDIDEVIGRAIAEQRAKRPPPKRYVMVDPDKLAALTQRAEQAEEVVGEYRKIVESHMDASRQWACVAELERLTQWAEPSGQESGGEADDEDFYEFTGPLGPPMSHEEAAAAYREVIAAPQTITDLRAQALALTQRAEAAERQLSTVDHLLDRRDALAPFTTRVDKILHLLRVATAADPKALLSSVEAEIQHCHCDADIIRNQEAENQRLRENVERLLRQPDDSVTMTTAEYDALTAETRRLRGQSDTLTNILERKTEELQRLRGVVEAARKVSQARDSYQYGAHVIETNAIERAKERYRQAFVELDQALAVLDSTATTREEA